MINLEKDCFFEFDPQRALKLANEIAFPRLVGTPGEAKARAFLITRLEQAGYCVERQLFGFSTAPDTLLKAGLLMCQALLLALLALSWVEPSATVWPAVVLMGLALALPIFYVAAQYRAAWSENGQSGAGFKDAWLKWGQIFKSENLVAHLPVQSNCAASLPCVFLMAHYDSKSQPIPLVARIVCVVAAIIGSLVAGSLVLCSLRWPQLIQIAIYPAGLAILSILPLLILNPGNQSPGAIDNASGVGTVVHLAEVLASSASTWIDKIQVTILLTSAEELGLMGASAYLRSHQDCLKQQSQADGLYILNFDGVGTDGALIWVGTRRLKSRLPGLVMEVCQECGLSVRRFALWGALFDHIPFMQAGLDAISLASAGSSIESVHTSGDNVQKLHEHGFAQAGQVALRVIEKLKKR